MVGDTIVAVSSPPGPGLRAVVRLSGPGAIDLAGGLPGAVVFRAPHTYTRENVVEIHLPGAPPLVDALARRLVERGARQARPGEFTLRAFLNGRLDLARAEAVERVIAAEDRDESRAALDLLGGTFSRRLGALESVVMDLCADAEAAIDFVDQEIEILPERQAVDRASSALAELRDLLAESAATRAPDSRPTVVLFGRPNAGKSSLFNALAGADALVSPAAGTTRDLLSADLDVGMPLRLLDAAGQTGAPGGAVEAEAESRARRSVEIADLVVWVVDATDPDPSVPAVLRGRPVVLAVSKCDLADGEAVRSRLPRREAICTSARTGRGLGELKKALARAAGSEATGAQRARFRVSLRQHALLRDVEAALERAAGSAPGLGMEFVCLDLRAALDALGGISGRQVGEDLLDRIFSRFCLGK